MFSWFSLVKNNRKSEAHAPLPIVGEIVRIEETGDGRSAAHSARLRSLPYRKILIDLILPNASNSGSESFPILRGTVQTSFVRGDALYVFDSKVIGSSRTGAVVLQRPSVVTRVQRRQYFRLQIESATTYRHLSLQDSDVQVGRILNLSGGGALLASSKPVLKASLISLRVPSGADGEHINVPARVLESIATGNGRARSYLLRTQFPVGQGFDEETRDSLIAYIFQSQRAALKARRRA